MNENRSILHKFKSSSLFLRIFVGLAIVALISGTATGYILANGGDSTSPTAEKTDEPQSAHQDTRTFRDFAQGKIYPSHLRNQQEYTEGTHLLVRDGAQPVALTSSVLDLSEYEGKTVKVLGETQKAVKEGWLMDVGKVEEIK